MWFPAGAFCAVPDSIRALMTRLQDDARDSDSWVRLGAFYLSSGDSLQAEWAFKKAIRYGKSAKAHNDWE